MRTPLRDVLEWGMSTSARALARRRWAKAKREPKTCLFCGIVFQGSEKQVYCTPPHQNAAAAKRFRERRRRPAGGEGATDG